MNATVILTAAEILALPLTHYARIFDKTDLRRSYREMMMRWHPDHCKEPQAADVFHRIRQMHELAEAAVSTGEWANPGEIVLWDYLAKKSVAFGIKATYRTTLVESHIGRTSVLHIVDANQPDLAKQALRVIESMKPMPHADLEKKVGPWRPKIVRHNIERSGVPSSLAYALARLPTMVRLADLMTQRGDALTCRHVAWIVSRLYEMACYFEMQGITYLGFNADYIYIDPPSHLVAPLGGWEFAAFDKRKPLAAPDAMVADAYKKNLDAGRPYRVHLVMIRRLGVALLRAVGKTENIPSVLANWFQMAAGEKPASVEFADWEKCLREAFGPRKFVEMPVTFDSVYSKKED